MQKKYYINLFTDDRFVEDDLYDADHLCEIGAEKLTKFLNDYILSLHIMDK